MTYVLIRILISKKAINKWLIYIETVLILVDNMCYKQCACAWDELGRLCHIIATISFFQHSNTTRISLQMRCLSWENMIQVGWSDRKNERETYLLIPLPTNWMVFRVPCKFTLGFWNEVVIVRASQFNSVRGTDMFVRRLYGKNKVFYQTYQFRQRVWTNIVHTYILNSNSKISILF